MLRREEWTQASSFFNDMKEKKLLFFRLEFVILGENHLRFVDSECSKHQNIARNNNN